MSLKFFFTYCHLSQKLSVKVICKYPTVCKQLLLLILGILILFNEPENDRHIEMLDI